MNLVTLLQRETIACSEMTRCPETQRNLKDRIQSIWSLIECVNAVSREPPYGCGDNSARHEASVT